MSIAPSEHPEPSKRAGTNSAPRSRRQFFRDALAVAAPKPVSAPAQVVPASVIAAPSTWSDVKLRLVRRATLGLTNADVLDVRQMGYQQWLNDQVHHAGIDDTALDAAVAARYPLLSQTTAQLFVANANTVQSQLQEATIYRAHVLESPAVRAHGRVLERPLQHRDHQGRLPQGGRRPRRHSQARARQVLRLAVRERAQPGDARVPRPEPEPCRRAEPELRARTHGTAHAWRGRRLHAGRRGRIVARADRMDDHGRRRFPVPRRHATTSARRPCLA